MRPRVRLPRPTLLSFPRILRLHSVTLRTGLTFGMTTWKTAPHPGACGRGCAPGPKILFGGEDCLSEASSAAQVIGTGAKAPSWGHDRAPMVLGPFAETKEPVLSLSKEPRRAGAKPRMKNKNPGSSIKNVEDDRNGLYSRHLSTSRPLTVHRQIDGIGFLPAPRKPV